MTDNIDEDKMNNTTQREAIEAEQKEIEAMGIQ